MPLMDFKAAFAHLKRNPGERLRFWFCSQDGSGRPAMLVAPPHQKITQQETRTISKTAKNKQACVGELEMDSEGTLIVAPFHTLPHALDMGVKFVAREHECTPRAIRILAPQAEATDDALATKSLDPGYRDEEHKNAWGAHNLGLRDDGEGGLRPPTEEEIAARREFTGKRTKYMNAAERARQKLDVAPGGKVADAQGQAVTKGKLGVVMAPQDGGLYTFGAPARPEIEGVELRYHHSTPFAGGDVAAAGHLYTAQGRLIAIDDASGHYKPSAELTLQMVRALAAGGATVDRRQLVPGDAPGEFREIDPAAWQAANAALAKPRAMLRKLDTRRQQLCAAALAAEAAGANDELAALLHALDENAEDVERLCAALDRHLDAQLEPLGISREALAEQRARLQDTEWVDAEEFKRVDGDMETLRALVESKPGGMALELPPKLPASVLNSHEKLNAVLAQFGRRAAARGQVLAVKDGVNAAAPRNKELAVFLQGKQGVDDETFKTLQKKWLDDDKAALKAVLQALPAQAASDAALLDAALGANPARNDAIAQMLRDTCRTVFQRPPSNLEDTVNILVTKASILLVRDFDAETATTEALADQFKSSWGQLLAPAGSRLADRRKDVVRYFDEHYGVDAKRNAALSGLEAGDFVGRGALNLKIGDAMRLRLSASQFEATGGDEVQARHKRAMLDELRARVNPGAAEAKPEQDVYGIDELVRNEPHVVDALAASDDDDEDDDDDEGWMDLSDDSDYEDEDEDEGRSQVGYHQPDPTTDRNAHGYGRGDEDDGDRGQPDGSAQDYDGLDVDDPQGGDENGDDGLDVDTRAPQDGDNNGYGALDVDTGAPQDTSGYETPDSLEAERAGRPRDEGAN